MNPYMQFMNPFPHQGNQMQNQSYPHPSYEAIPPQFRGYPEGYQYHPFYHPGMNGFAYPSQYYGCSNHNFFPSYCPPSSMPYGGHHHPTHCCGGYSVPPPGAQHPCHFPPLLPTMGPTQFEYQKDNPQYQHSFDCPNNTRKGGNLLKIEEPETEPRGDTSAVPSDFKNSPYPIVLVPPNYIKDNSGRKANESTCDRQEVFPWNRNEHQPLFLNGWLPVDIDKWKSSEQVDDDSGRKIHKENESPQDVSSNFPLPIFYVPYKANDLGTMEQKNVGQQCSPGASVEQMADRPLSPIHMDFLKDKSNERIIVSKDPRIKENSEGKKNAQTTEAASGTSSKHVGNEARKTSGDGKKNLSSPTKSSKLPPVCLRVDPLPKKKKDCSPSKPSNTHDEKDKSGDSFKEDTKSMASPSPDGAKVSPDDILVRNKTEEQGASNEQPKRKVKTIKVYDAESQPGEDVLVSNINCTNANEGRSAHPFTVEDQPNLTQAEKNEAGKFNSSISRELSEDEAAKIIQSAYRGYEERKWQPLKKLKNIKAVQDEVTRLKKQIEALECTQDNTLLDKSRTVIGETIMNLLLKLDSIQGLPPNVRQVRKSMARELMSLQEQLDALGQRQAEKTILSASLAKSEEEMPTADGACVQDDQGKNQLVLESVTEIDEKDKSKNQEEPPLIELSMDEENEVRKEDVPDVVDRYSIQLNDILQNGSETLKDESPKDVSSNTGNLVSELLSPSVHNLESESLPVRLVEDKVNSVPNMGPVELQEQVPLEPEEKENGDDYGLPEQTPSISKMTSLIEVGDENRPETVDEASGDDTSDLNKPSVNVEPVSEDPVTEHVQDFSVMNNEKADDPAPESLTESTTQVQDFSVTNDEKADDPVPVSLTESTTQVPDFSVTNNEKTDDPVPESLTESTTQVQAFSVTNNEKADDPVPESLTESTTQVPDFCVTNKETTQVPDFSVTNKEKADDPVPESLTESTTQLHDFFVTNNEKTDDPLPVSLTGSTTQVHKGCEGVQGVEENSGRLLEQNESIEPDETRCEEPAIVVDEDYDAPADLNTLPREKKQADDSLEMFGHPCELTVTSDLKETDEGKFLPISSSQSGFAGTDRSLIEENERLREQMQKIIEAGQEQLSAISGLSRKVRDLERKLHRKKKVKLCRSRAGPRSSSSFKMSMDDEIPFALAN